LIRSELAIENKINEIIEKEASVDFWLHPNDIYQDEEFFLFAHFLKRLISKFNQEILWLTSLHDMWAHYKSIQQVTIHLDEMDSSNTILVIHNSGDNIIKKLAIDFKNISFDIEDKNIKIQNNKVILKTPIDPNEAYKIRIKNICYKN
jgi:hypothetical protein